MEVIPAIDLLDGKVVRLEQGDYQRVTVYDADPVALAQRFAEAGAKRLHVVDLEGARRGSAVHTAVIEAILRATSMAIQVGGGVRDAETARRLVTALAEVPPLQRDAFLLHVEGGLPLDEIARLTATSGETVKSRLRYAYRRLRAKLEDLQ